MTISKRRLKTKQPVISKITGLPIDPKRSRSAKKAAATRKANTIANANSRSLRVHHKIFAGGAIVVVLLFTFFGVRSQLQAYAASTATGTFVGLGGKCLDNSGARLSSNNRIQLYTCNGSLAQKWVLTSTGSLKANAGSAYCLDVPGNSKAEYTYLRLWKCNDSAAQHFTVSSNTLVGKTTGFCATVHYAEATNGTKIWMKACHGSDSQKWSYSGATNDSGRITSPPVDEPTPVSGGSSGSGTSGIASNVSYDSLSGAAFGKRVSSAGSGKIVGLDAITYSFSDFKDTNNAGAYISAKGIVGKGIGSTIIQMTPHTMTGNASTTLTSGNGTPNPYDLLRFTAPGATLADVTIQGTEQGYDNGANKAKVYGGVFFANVANPVIKNVKISSVPGWYYYPPGETMALNFNHATNPTMTDVEIDGANIGASGIGPNSTSGGTYTNIYVHNNKYSAGMAFWQQTNGATINNLRTLNNRTGLNLERVTGTITVNNPVFSGNTSQDVFFGNDQGAGKLVLNYTTAPTAKLRVNIPAKEQGNPNKQTKNDVKLYVNGVDKTSTYINF